MGKDASVDFTATPASFYFRKLEMWKAGEILMKKQSEKSKNVGLGKALSIYTLFTVSVIIALLGILFSVYSLTFNISFKVLNTSVPGIIFGLVVAYLGIRYFFLVRKLKAEVFKTGTHFSWSNFKPRKIFKSRKSHQFQ